MNHGWHGNHGGLEIAYCAVRRGFVLNWRNAVHSRPRQRRAVRRQPTEKKTVAANHDKHGHLGGLVSVCAGVPANAERTFRRSETRQSAGVPTFRQSRWLTPILPCERRRVSGRLRLSTTTGLLRELVLLAGLFFEPRNTRNAKCGFVVQLQALFLNHGCTRKPRMNWDRVLRGAARFRSKLAKRCSHLPTPPKASGAASAHREKTVAVNSDKHGHLGGLVSVLAGLPENAGRTFRRSETRQSAGEPPFRHPGNSPAHEVRAPCFVSETRTQNPLSALGLGKK